MSELKQPPSPFSFRCEIVDNRAWDGVIVMFDKTWEEGALWPELGQLAVLCDEDSYDSLVARIQVLEEALKARFSQGYLCALSCIVSGHGMSVPVEEALAAHGPVDWSVIDEHDQGVFLEAEVVTREAISSSVVSQPSVFEDEK